MSGSSHSGRPAVQLRALRVRAGVPSPVRKHIMGAVALPGRCAPCWRGVGRAARFGAPARALQGPARTVHPSRGDMLDPQHQPTIMDAGRASDAELRATPAGSGHTVQFYEDEAFLRETVARYLGAGLIADEPVVVIATEPHRRAFQESLAAKGFDVERASAAGRLTVLDARATLDAFMVAGMPQWEPFRSLVGGTIDRCLAACERKRVRLYGEMVDVLWRDGNPQAAIRLEELWNDLGRARPFSLLCAYVMGNFFKEAHGEPFARICNAHDHVVPAESYSESDERDKRLREISLLQQRARALETELKRRSE